MLPDSGLGNMVTTNRYLWLNCALSLLLAQSAQALPVGINPAIGLSDQWYVGLGGGASFLQPNPVQSSIDPVDDQDSYSTVSIGRDMGRLASLQLQFHSLGSVRLADSENASYGEDASYSAIDGALLYRFYDSRDWQLVPSQLGISLYGLAGLGSVSRDIDSGLPLQNKTEFYLSYGIGAEIFLNQSFSFRFQGSVVDKDAQYASLSLITRFGSSKPQLRLRPVAADSAGDNVGPDTRFEPVPSPGSTVPDMPVPAPPIAASPVTAPSVQLAPVTGGQSPESNSVYQDSDNDGVADARDRCNDSVDGFPVRASGCSLFKGVLSAVRFEASSASLLPASRAQLDALVNVLVRYPQARIQILAHTDNALDETEQAILTRGRIRTLGTYLLSQGIRANRLILRSMGGSTPVADNATATGREQNNRIEVLEYQ